MMINIYRKITILVIYFVLQTLMFQRVHCFYIDDLTDEGDDSSVSRSGEGEELQSYNKDYTSDTRARTLIEILKLLQNNLSKHERKEHSVESDDIRGYKYNEEDQGSVDKRNYGILPPWRELCRMMKITHCSANRS